MGNCYGKRSDPNRPRGDRQADPGTPDFGDWKPLIDDVPAQQRFIDVLRKGHVDNWVHHEWSGTAADALRYIDPRLSTLLALSRDAEARVQVTAKALRRLARWAAVLSMEIHQGKRDADTAAKRLLQFVEQLRDDLLDFSAGDRYNFMLFRADGDALVPGPRIAHHAIVQRNRTWRSARGTLVWRPSRIVFSSHPICERRSSPPATKSASNPPNAEGYSGGVKTVAPAFALLRDRVRVKDILAVLARSGPRVSLSPECRLLLEPTGVRSPLSASSGRPTTSISRRGTSLTLRPEVARAVSSLAGITAGGTFRRLRSGACRRVS